MRRRFHMYPELKFEEKETSKIVKKELEKFGYETYTIAETGVIGILKGSGNKMVALRADMDALALEEENDVPYRSKIPGKMHACGHDAHTAMLLGAAKILSEIRDSLGGNVKLIFQPAEEGGCGSQKIIEEGGLKGVNAIFGIHVWADLPSGTIATRKGPMMASSDGFLIEIRGKGGHVALPHLTKDPTVPAADIYNALQKIVSRYTNPFSSVVIAAPVVESSHAYNVTPSRIVMQGTLRTFDMEIRNAVMERLKRVVEKYSEAWDCEGKVSLFRAPYPPTVNTSELAEFIMDTAREISEVAEAQMVLVSEDFSYYLQEIPGAFAFLGIKNEGKNIIYPHHHPRFDVDEDVLWKGVALYVLLAYGYLRGSF
ncbi:MAG: amidohydrolase [Synergistetes bacterium]|nr:amidohydrolase [Synergistota bacterium]